MTSSATARSTDGVDVAVHDLGGEGPALVIAHATGFHGLAYEPLARELTSSHRVWALDFRGHGRSTTPTTGDFAWSGMAADLIAAIDAIGLETVAAFGHSLGGAAILLAERQRPGLISTAYLYEPIVVPSEPPPHWRDNPLPEAARRRRDVFASRAEALERYSRRPPLSILRADALAAYVEHGFVDRADGSVQLACRPEHEARTFESDGEMTIEQLDSITPPVMVGVGQATGTPDPAEFAPAIAAGLPRGRLAVYEDLGHFGPLQAPEVIAPDVVAAT